MKKLLIFDVDGTVLDTLDDLMDALNYALARRGYPTHTKEAVRGMVGNGMEKLVERGVPEEVSRGDLEGVMKDFRGYYGEHSADKTTPYPGVVALLGELKKRGYRLALLSNKADDAVQVLCRRFFPGTFDHTAGEIAGVRRKPAPDGVFRILEVMGCQQSEAVYIGDSEVDVATAQNAGLDMVTVLWGFRDRETLLAHGAEHLAAAPEEVLEQLATL